MIERGKPILWADLVELGKLANFKLRPAKEYSFAQGGSVAWLDELNRIRRDCFERLTKPDLWTPEIMRQVMQSGPGPEHPTIVQSSLPGNTAAPVDYGPGWAIDYDAGVAGSNSVLNPQAIDLEFYYPEEAGDPVVSCQSYSVGVFQYRNLLAGGPGGDVNSSRVQISIRGGGNLYQRSDARDMFWTVLKAGGNPQASYHSTLPNVTWSRSEVMDGAVISAHIGAGWVDPDDYFFEVTSTDGFMRYGGPAVSATVPRDNVAPTLVLEMQKRGGEVVPGIHRTSAIRRIKAPLSDLWNWGVYPLGWDGYILPSYAYDAGRIEGIWAGKTVPIATFTEDIEARIPPNYVADPLGPRARRQAPDPGNPAFVSTRAQTYALMRYPFHRDIETPWDFPAIGFENRGLVIQDVSVHRRPVANSVGMLVQPAGAPELPVTLGCMRNGRFTAFETVTIPAGQPGTRFYPFWPTFTPNHLVYQCTEQIDVQALLIDTLGLAYQKNDWVHDPVYFPLCAAHYNDTERCLGLLP